MNRSPFERSPSAGLGIPAVAIAVAMGLGYLWKRQDPSGPIGAISPPAPPDLMMPLRVEATQAGLRFPKLSSRAVWLDRFRPEPNGYAAWVRFDLKRGQRKAFDLPGGIEFPCKDETGKRWPCDTVWDQGSVYVAIPQGYPQAPKELVANAEQMGAVLARLPFPTLPPPKPLAPPKLIEAWPGLTAAACTVLSDTITTPRVRFDAPLPTGHILMVRGVGSSSTSKPSSYAWGVKGPEAADYLRIVDCDLRYPETTTTAYFDVQEMRPRRIRRVVEFENVPITMKFDDPWITGDSEVADFGYGIRMWIHGRDAAPYRAPQRHRSVLPIDFAAQGIVFHLTARLVSPEGVKGVPLRLEMNPNGRPSFPPRSVANEVPTSFEKIRLEIEADVYEEVRKATLAVDLTRPQVIREIAPGLVRPFRIWVDSQPIPPGYHPSIPPSRGRTPIIPGLPSP